MFGELSEGKADDTGLTHFRIEKFTPNHDAKTVSVVFTYGTAREDEDGPVFVPAHQFRNLSCQINNPEAFDELAQQEFTEQAVADYLLGAQIF